MNPPNVKNIDDQINILVENLENLKPILRSHEILDQACEIIDCIQTKLQYILNPIKKQKYINIIKTYNILVLKNRYSLKKYGRSLFNNNSTTSIINTRIIDILQERQ